MDQIRGPSTRIKDQNHCSMTEPEAWVLTWKFPTGWTLNRHGGTWCLQAPAGSPDPHSPPCMAAVECGGQLTDDYRVPSFLPNHQEWYSLFLISSSFSMYLVILLPRKRRHILDMLHCWETGNIVISGWEWALPSSSVLSPENAGQQANEPHVVNSLVDYAASAKETNQGNALVQGVYCSGPGVLPQPVPSLRQHRWAFTAFIPLYYPLESEVSSSSYPPKPFVVRHTGENEERSNHRVSKICLCGCPSNSFHSTLSLWLPLPAPCIPLFMLMLQPEPDHTIWAPVSTTALVCWCAPRSTPAWPSCFMVWFYSTQP